MGKAYLIDLPLAEKSLTLSCKHPFFSMDSECRKMSQLHSLGRTVFKECPSCTVMLQVDLMKINPQTLLH